jgi:hypothetical protein
MLGIAEPGVGGTELAVPGAVARTLRVTPDAADGSVILMLSGDFSSAEVPSSAAAAPGNAVKKALAIRARVATSGNPEGTSGVGVRSLIGVRIVVVLTDFDIIEHCDRIVRQDRLRAVQRDQVRGDRLPADAHEAHGKSGTLLTREAGLE